VARYPYISSPDTKGKYADNKFKTKLVCKIDDAAALAAVEQIKAAAVEIHGKSGTNKYMPFVIDEDEGEIIFIGKSTYAPGIFDAKGNKANVLVGGGSTLRMMGNLVEFDKGISLQLNQVQIKDLSTFGQCAFDEIEDGYEFDSSDAFTPDLQQDNHTVGDNSNVGATDGSALEI
jgi:hypothetical protein